MFPLKFHLVIVFLCVSTLPVVALAQSMSGGDPEGETISFDSVQPILRKHCERCHNEDQPRGDLVLTSLDKVLAGSSSGFVVVPGKVEESPLYLLTAHIETPKMPPNKPRIPQRELNIIEKWITTGLIAESQASGKVPTQKLQSEQAITPSVDAPMKSTSPLDAEPKTTSIDEKVFGTLASIPQPAPIRAIAPHPSQPIVAVSGLHQVALLNTKTSKLEPQAIEVGERDVSALRFSPDGRFLFIAAGMVGESGSVLVLDWNTKQWLPSIGDESDQIQSLDCNHDGSQIAIGTTTRLVKTFDRITQKEHLALRKHTDWVLSVAFSRDGFLIATGDRFGGIHIWETDTGKEFAALRGQSGGITGLVWSADGNELFSSSLDGTIRVWNMHTFQVEKQCLAHERGVLSIAIDSRGELLSSGRDGWLRQWTKADAKPIWQRELPDEAISVCSSVADQGIVIGADAAGGMYCFSSALPDTNDPSSKTAITFPKSQMERSFASIVPIAPKRTSLKPSIPIDQSVASGQTAPRLGSITQTTSAQTLQSDLEESRKTLESVEQSLEQTYRTAEQLEESVARLKQLIIMQETRLKQMELKQKPNRNP
jgi:WD40 repeat protein